MRLQLRRVLHNRRQWSYRGFSTNPIEGIWSVLKRFIKRVFGTTGQRDMEERGLQLQLAVTFFNATQAYRADPVNTPSPIGFFLGAALTYRDADARRAAHVAVYDPTTGREESEYDHAMRHQRNFVLNSQADNRRMQVDRDGEIAHEAAARAQIQE
jgi:hypothetical protein